MKRPWTAIIATVALIGLLSACSQPAPAPTAPPAAAPTAVPAAAPTAAPAAPKPAPTTAPAPAATAAPAKDAAPTSFEEIPIGSIFASTGATASFGIPGRNAMRLAVKEINDKGFKVGDKWYKFKLLEEDDGSTAEGASASALKVITQGSAKFLVGGNTSAEGKPIAGVATDKQVIYFGASTIMGSLSPTSPYLFHNLTDPQAVAGPWAKEIVKVFGSKKIALIIPNDDAGKLIVDEWTKGLAKQGLQLATVQQYPAKTTDFYPYLTNIKAVGPDTIVGGYSDPDMEAQIRQGIELGLTGINWVARGPSIKPALAYLKNMKGYFMQSYPVEIDLNTSPAMTDYKKRFKAFHGRDPDMANNDSYGVFVYDVPGMLVAGMQKAGTVSDLMAISKALTSFEYDGITGKLKYDSNRQVYTAMDTVLVKPDGSKVVYPLTPEVQ